MEESFEDKLSKVNLLEIYDDIAELELRPEEIVELCKAFSCRVNLKEGNLVHLVERKYKDKLTNYKPSKRLKWLRANLTHILRNPEAKYLKLQQQHNKGKRIKWLIRKLNALDYFWDPSANMVNTEEQYTSLSPLQQRIRCRLTNESCSSLGNTSTDSVLTVIASQPHEAQDTRDANKNTESSITELRDLSLSMTYSNQLPSSTLDAVITPDASEAQASDPAPPNITKKNTGLLAEEWSESSLQEDEYATFHQDMQVTSTQEFETVAI